MDEGLWPCCARRATPPGCACCCCCAQAELDGQRADRDRRARASRGSPGISSCWARRACWSASRKEAGFSTAPPTAARAPSLGAALAALADPSAERGRHGAAGACARGPRRRRRRLFQGQCGGMGAHPRAACAGKRCRSGDRARMTARPIENLLDAGTGTGRMLELLAPHARRAVGVDVSPEMLAIARDRLLREELPACARCGWPIPIACLSRRRRKMRLRCRAVPSGAALSRRSRRGGGRSGAGDGAGRAASDRRFRAA